MRFDYARPSIVAGWILILAAIAVSLNVGSATGWLLLVGVGLLPALILFGLRRQPTPTLSESIRDVVK